MPRLVSLFALAAAFIPAVLANNTDCNIGHIDLLDNSGRETIATTQTDFETTRYEAYLTSQPTSSVYFDVSQNGASSAEFTIRLNGEVVNAVPGNVESPRVEASGFSTQCGTENLVLVEVHEVKNVRERYDSCNFKYEIHYHNPAC